MKAKLLILIALIGIFFTSCGPGTRMTATWKNPEYSRTEKPKKLFIAVLTQKLEVRQMMENQLGDAAMARGLKILKSYERFPPSTVLNQNISNADAIKSIQEAGCDAILLVTMLDKQEKTRYVEGSTYVYPGTTYGWYNTYDAYYGHYQEVVTTPGYYTTDTEYYLETSLFDAKTNQLVWTGQSVTYSPPSVNKFVSEFKMVLLNQLKKDGITQPEKKK
jgi:hypothetical protein